MKFMSGWTWYCEYHDSFGTGDSELEVQLLANAHINFHIKAGDPCQMYFKNQGEPSKEISPRIKNEQELEKPATYMSKIKENFARAWQKWDASEDAQLRENFDARSDLNQLTQLHQRAEGGIVARLKKLGLVDEELEVQQVKEMLKNSHEKLIKMKTYSGKLRVKEIGHTSPRISRGKESLAKFGMVNPPLAPLPDLKHTSLFTCSICNHPVVGNSCRCIGD